MRSPEAANSATLADAAVSQWHAIDAALAPIIGTTGVAALYHRSLYLSVKVHPWLEHERNAELQGMDLQALRDLLSRRQPAEVSEAGGTLLRIFRELLASLVGASLAERLLGPLWAQLPASSTGQDSPT